VALDDPQDADRAEPAANPAAAPAPAAAADAVAGEVTRILARLEQGEPRAAEHLLPLVYEQLRKLAAVSMAQLKPDQTLQATALVHEAYLRVVGTGNAQHWNSRGHFFGAAAEAMRRILLNRARDKARIKRGGQCRRIDLDKIELAVDTPQEDLLAVDEALERLAEENQPCADLVKLRFFAGLSMEQAAAALGVSRSTATRYWAYARAWLFAALRPDDSGPDTA
jgi:RNA polymerase sigma factor (TIGR02999 family)